MDKIFVVLVCFLFIACNDKEENEMSDIAMKNLEATRVINLAFMLGDTSKVDSVVTADYIDHTEMGDLNRDSLKSKILWVRKFEPNMKTEILNELANDSIVITQVHYTGNSDGSGGMPKGPYSMHAIHVSRCKDGKIAEHWEYMEMRDMVRMLSQMTPPKESVNKNAQ